MRRGDEDENPVVQLELTINCVSLEEKDKPTTNAKGRRKKSGKWDHFWHNNLTVLIVRSDGKLVTNMSMPWVGDATHSSVDISARKLDSKTSVISFDAEFSDPQQSLTAYVGVNEISGMQSSVEYKPELPSDFFPPKEPIPEGQVGNGIARWLMAGWRRFGSASP